MKKYGLNHIMWIRMLEVVLINPKTHMVVIKVALQQLDQYKNNGSIFKLNEILLGQIWVCCFIWFLVIHGFILWLWNWYSIYYTSRGMAL